VSVKHLLFPMQSPTSQVCLALGLLPPHPAFLANEADAFCTILRAASVFGEHNKLAPIHPDRLAMWRREMEWLLCVTDYIVELVPAWHTSAAGVLKEVGAHSPAIFMLGFSTGSM
jgi:hypothetical protein